MAQLTTGRVVRQLPYGQLRVALRRERLRRWLGRGLLYAMTLAGALLFVTPFMWTLLSSLKTPGELYTYPPRWLPAAPQFGNYRTVFARVPFELWLVNSAVVSTTTTLGEVLSAVLVGYSFARLRYPGRQILFMVMISTMMLPAEVTLLPLYLLFARLGWLDGYRPLVVPSFFGGSALLIFLMRQFFLTIPRDLDDAARIDGASYLRVLWQILLPNCTAALLTAGILSLVNHWNAFLYPFIFLNSKSRYTVAVGIRYFQAVAGGVDSMEYTEHLLMAASILMTAPIVLLFFLGQRYFVRGIIMSGLRG